MWRATAVEEKSAVNDTEIRLFCLTYLTHSHISAACENLLVDQWQLHIEDVLKRDIYIYIIYRYVESDL